MQKWIQWLKSHNSVRVILILAIFFLFIIFFRHLVHVTPKYEIERKYLDSVIYYRDKAGKTITKTYERLSYELSDADRNLIDSLRNQLSLKRKQLTEIQMVVEAGDYQHVNAKLDTFYIRDSFPVYRYIYSDASIQYKAEASIDSLRFDYLRTRDSVYLITTTKKVKGIPYKEIHIAHTNQNINMVGVKSLSIKEEPRYRRFSLGAHVGYDPFNKRPAVSIGINLDLIRFKKK